LVIHRIVEKKAKGYSIKGDNSKMIETGKFPESIIGKITDNGPALFSGIIPRQTDVFIVAVLSRCRIIELYCKIVTKWSGMIFA